MIQSLQHIYLYIHSLRKELNAFRDRESKMIGIFHTEIIMCEQFKRRIINIIK